MSKIISIVVAAVFAFIASMTAGALPLNKADYDARLAILAHVGTSTPSKSAKPSLWPVKTVYPNAGAILPFRRIVAFYGNFGDPHMGVLGEYPEDYVLGMLATITQMWTLVDPKTPALPAIQYIAIVAQGYPQKSGKYILHSSDKRIDKALDMANQMHGILILDVQVGRSSLEQELPLLEKYLRMPQVHLAVDPEFSMKRGGIPSKIIGTFDASDINYAARYLASLVQKYNLPPKVFVVHRFTQKMVTNYKEIRPLPEVQIVMDMDGWGFKAKKRASYRLVASEPVQFMGIKLFLFGKGNDLKPPSAGLLTTDEVLGLMPTPIYVQYQ